MQLTERQEEVLAFVSEYQRDNKVPPSTRIIQRHFGFASQTSVVRILASLASKSVLEQLPDGVWGAKANEVQSLFALPIYGAIPAGIPTMQDEHLLRSIAIDPALFGVRPTRHHLL